MKIGKIEGAKVAVATTIISGAVIVISGAITATIRTIAVIITTGAVIIITLEAITIEDVAVAAIIATDVTSTTEIKGQMAETLVQPGTKVIRASQAVPLLEISTSRGSQPNMCPISSLHP